MASLTGQLVAETYKALLKLIDNDILTASEKQITDGFGGGSNVFIDSQGFLRANKYKVTNGLATQFLKADGSLDSNAYLTSITGAQVITALGYTPVPTTRTITINGETHNLAADNSWTVGGTAAIWGNITGTLSNQTDLQNALNAKYNNPTGTISQYIRGDGTLATFPTMPGGLPTGGSAGQILAKIDATDYNAQWIDNYATQTKNEVKLGQTLTKGTPVYVSSANGTNMIVSAASNTSEALSSKTLGLLETGGATNDLVKCVTFGLLAGLDTSAASAGDPVWLGPNGTLIYGLVNKPYAPAHLVYIGVVTRVQSNNGEIFVNVQNGFELKEIHDVYIADPANNHGLFYDIADGLWKNKSIASALGYTPQAQLSGTGFVKASGTTITYDNSTYLTTADAASTYQLLTNLSTDLTASATKYPSVNAVIAGLGTKLNLSGGTLTGNLTISSANPKLLLTDTDNNPDYSIQNADGTFKISDETNSADRFLIYSTGIGYYNGDFKANKLYVEGGLSTQFIKADGTLDSNTYLTSASLAGYLATAGGTMTGDLNFYTLKTTRVGGNAYIRGSWQGTYWGIGAAATGHTIIIDQVDFSTGAYESITDVNLMLGTRTVVHSGNVATYALPISGGTVTGSITATSFVKSGGTSSQFLMADGSVTTLSSPVTGSGSAGYVPKWTTAANIGSSNIYDDGTSIGIAYSTPNKGGYGRTLTGAAFGSASFGFEAVGGTTTNGGLVGGLSFILSQNDSSRIVGAAIQSYLVGTTATNYGSSLRFYAKPDGGSLAEVMAMSSAGLRVYGTIIKDGGTSSQYLMADGSVTTLTGIVTGSGTTNYLPKWTSSSALGNSLIFDNGTNVIIGTNVPNIGTSKLEVIGTVAYNGVVRFINSVNQGDVNHGTLMIVNSANYAIGNDASIGFALNNSSNSNLDPRASIGVKTSGNLSGDIVFNTRTEVDYTEKVRISSIGNLGIGTPTPSSYSHGGSNRAIEIRNTDTSSNAQSHVILTSGATANTGSIGTISWALSNTAGNKLGALIASNIVINSTTNAYTNLAFYTANGAGPAYAMQITNTGNLLINTQTDSGFKLDVNGTGRFISFLNANAQTTTGNGSINIESLDPAIRFRVTGGTANRRIYEWRAVAASGVNDIMQLRLWNDAQNSADTLFTVSSIGGGTFYNTLRVNSATKLGGSGYTDYTYRTLYVGQRPYGDAFSIINMNPSLGDNNYGFDIQVNDNGTAGSQFFGILNNRDGAQYFKIFGNGNVAINSSTDSGFKLDVGGSARIQGGLTGTSASFSSDISLSGNLILNTGADRIIQIGSSSNYYWRLKAAGDDFEIRMANAFAALKFYYPNGSATFASSVTATNLYLGSLTNEQLMISGTGSRGIGVSTITSGDPYVRLYDNTSIKADIWWDRGTGAMGINSLGSGSKTAINPFGGNVGIGNTGASNLLTIGQDVTIHYTQTGIAAMTLKGFSSGARALFEIHSADAAVKMVLQSVSGYGVNLGALTASDMIINNPSGNITLKSNGNVLIGTSTDSGHKLNVNGVVNAGSGFTGGGGYFTSQGQANNTPSVPSASIGVYANTYAFIELSTSDVNGGWIDFSKANGGDYGGRIRYYANPNRFGFHTNGGSETITFSSGGSITATSFFESSDYRLKTLIESNPIIDGIEKLEAKLYEKDGKIELGYFAQDAELIMPYAVTKNADGFLSLSYREVHTAKIARLEQRVAELEKQLNVA